MAGSYIISTSQFSVGVSADKECLPSLFDALFPSFFNSLSFSLKAGSQLYPQIMNVCFSRKIRKFVEPLCKKTEDVIYALNS